MSPTLYYFQLFLLIASAIGAEDPKKPGPIYTAVASKVVYARSVYNVSVSVEPSSGKEGGPLRIFAEIGRVNETLAKGEITILPGESQVLSIPVEDLPERDYNLTLRVIEGETGKPIESKTPIFASKKETSILIQTDKAVYKPGERVRFRVVLLDRTLKPLTEDQAAEIKFYDASNNLIKKFPEVVIESAFYKNELQLSSEPVLGDWRIEVKLKNKTETAGSSSSASGGKSSSSLRSSKRRPHRPRPRPVSRNDPTEKVAYFNVDQYVLPKYEVRVKLPNFITYSDYNVPVQVEAKYTYGKPVVGECTLRVKRRYSYDENDVISKTFSLNGTGLQDVNIATLFKKGSNNYEQDVSFEAKFTDDATGKELQAESSVRIYKYSYKIEQIRQTESLKPGLPYSATFKISTQDNIPIADASPSALKISHGFAYDTEGSSFTSSIPANGLVSMRFRTPTNIRNQPRIVDIKYKDLTQTFSIPSFYNTDSSVYMQIQLQSPGTEGPPSDVSTDVPVSEPVYTVKSSKLVVNVNATEPFKTVNYFIHGRQTILASEQIKLATPASEYNLEIPCPEDADPEARLVVYLVLSGSGDFLADSLKFKAVKGADNRDNNFLNVTLSQSKLEPGENITLKLESTQGSLIALRGVDQSVLLLKEDKDITQKSLDEEVSDRENEAVWYNRNWGGSEAFRTFEEGGLVVLTNANLKNPNVIQPTEALSSTPQSISSAEISADSAGFAAPPGAAAAFRPQTLSNKVSGPSGSGGGEPAAIRTRKDFPESWLWEEVTLNESSNFDLVKTVPDTITSWIISGYSLNPSTGVGILTPTQKFTTFRPFFISLDLPYSVVKGEVLLLKVLIHNYLPDEKDVTADITIKNENGDFEFAGNPEGSQKEQTIPITLKPNSVSAIKLAVIPQKFGLIMLNVVGRTSMAGDALIQPLRVIPPGQRQKRSTAVLLDPLKEAKGSLVASFPDKRVEGADSLKLTLISDILGPTISNLDQLLEMPTGCGEQNMMAFVVDTIVLNYFKNSNNKLEEGLQSKAISYLESGYQRQLTYKHYDGSFSPFGNNDFAGSTWLTAFVTRSFIQAQKFITVDDSLIQTALEFLARQQTSDGGFYENGPVFQYFSEGQSRASGVSLTAFTLLTFLEAQKNWEPESVNSIENVVNNKESTVNATIIEKALMFVTDRAQKSDFDDLFGLVLTTYAATLADHSSKDALFEKLLKLAKDDQGQTYWALERKTKKNVTEESNNSTSTTTETPIYIWEYNTKPISVEMTSYVLLTYIARGKAADALPLVRWLLNQRSAYGGFLSTQDTVVGLSGLAGFAQLTNTKDVDLKVQYKEGDSEKTATVSQQNKEELQDFDLANTTRTVDVAATGKGSVLAQLSWTYYVEDDNKSPAFSVDVTASETKTNDLALQICTKYLRGNSSNMAIIEVNLPSGYAFDSDSLEELKKNVTDYKRQDVENRNTKLVVYVEKVRDDSSCFPLVANKVFKVGKPVPSYVTVYDYYDTTKTGRAFYQPPAVSFCDICKEMSGGCNDKSC